MNHFHRTSIASINTMATANAMFNDLKIKVIQVHQIDFMYFFPQYHLHNIPFYCFYVAEDTSFAEVSNAVQNRIAPGWSILRTTYQGKFWPTLTKCFDILPVNFQYKRSLILNSLFFIFRQLV